KSVTLYNFYTNKPIEIALDLRLTPVQNSQKYFKEYKKKQTAAVMLEKLMVDGENEITYLETVLDEIKRAEGEAELNDIRVELKA
ncbi:MAG: NFACT family protein, partial [Oscillospiraceae bacterium]